jgi:addiction module HigA family antidote
MAEKEKLLAPIHPGEILKTELMEPYGLSGNALARLLSVPANRVTEIINGERSISIDTALRLSKCFGMSAQMWMNLQTDYELHKARYDHLIEQIEHEVCEYASSKWAHAVN